MLKSAKYMNGVHGSDQYKNNSCHIPDCDLFISLQAAFLVQDTIVYYKNTNRHPCQLSKCIRKTALDLEMA